MEIATNIYINNEHYLQILCYDRNAYVQILPVKNKRSSYKYVR